ncbi:nucleotidyltransferase family protein [Halorussus halobius]|uniref:nucleotidyltransferase family protein n=1 Tax=Halorussus halobius TaxID=1710537 RepID=UPI00109208FC|nr:nucleotidyltransferase family protein [Halorussus halobius]
MILGVLLAAGNGSRFADSGADSANKLLATLDGRPVVAHAARTLTESRVDESVAVVGHDRERVADALPEEIDAVANPDYGAGQSASVRRGVAVARERDASAVLFALGDMPRIAVETVDALVAAYRDVDPAPGIVAPRYEGRRGNPVLFDARHFDALAAVTGDRGGRGLVESEPVSWVDVTDPGIHRDVDTERDLRALRRNQDELSRSDDSRG